MAQAIALSLGVDHGFLQARQAANQTASGRPPSITDLTSTDPLPYVAGTPARQGRLRSPWQNCMTLKAHGQRQPDEVDQDEERCIRQLHRTGEGKLRGETARPLDRQEKDAG